MHGEPMSQLIDELERHHQFLRERFDRVKKAGVESEEGRAALKQIKASLFAHLAKEDEQLYPALEEAALSDPRLADILTIFREDIAKVASAANAFFAGLESGQLKGLPLAREFGSLSAQFTLRIAKEESVLYAEYDKISR
jgi:Hemerythrin HHE cation binding domain